MGRERWQSPPSAAVVEACAKAAYVADDGCEDAWNGEYEGCKQSHRDIARAAIAEFQRQVKGE